MASRAELVERVIRPALDARRVRARGPLLPLDVRVPGARPRPARSRRCAPPMRSPRGGLVPDVTLVFTLDAAVRDARAGARGPRRQDRAGRRRLPRARGGGVHALRRRRAGRPRTRSAARSWRSTATGDESAVFERVLAALAARWPAAVRGGPMTRGRTLVAFALFAVVMFAGGQLLRGSLTGGGVAARGALRPGARARRGQLRGLARPGGPLREGGHRDGRGAARSELVAPR